MAEKSGFFNSLLVDGVYDRKYTAEDYCDNLAVVISNGVLRSTADDLKVTASGMVVTVGVGRGWINGHWYNNDTALSFAAITAPTGGNRYDRVVLRYDNTLNQRKVSLNILTGTAANTPTKPALTRTNSVYELCLADIYITAGATSVTVTDTRADTSVCGWVYSTSGDASFFTSLDNSFETWFQSVRNTLASVTLFKRYNWREVLATATSTVSFNIPQYDANTCFIEVYVNGMVETLTNDYTVSGTVITFTGTLVAGTEVEVKCYKSIDGTGIMTVADEITQLQNQYATLSGVSNFTYKCTGLNDNISLSQIAEAFYNGSYVAANVTAAANSFLTALGGNTYLAALATDAQVTINVVGRLGVTTAYAGAGTAASRYRYFSLGVAAVSDKRIIFDFAKTETITVNCADSTDNIIFYGTDLYIKNANVIAKNSGTSCAVTMFASNSVYGIVDCENCRFKILTTGKALIAQYGTFNNCILHVKSAADDAFCFDAKNYSVSRLTSCTCYAYTASASKTSSIFNVNSGVSGAKNIAYNISCPTIEQTGYTQKYLCVSNAGMTYINGVISTLTSSGTASYRSINGQI